MADDSGTLYKRAVDLALKGHVREALLLYDQAIALEPENAQYYNDKAIALFSLQQYNECIDCTLKATNLDPLMVNPWINRGAAYGQLGQFTKAYESLEHALLLDPKNKYAKKNFVLSKRKIKELEGKIPQGSPITEEELLEMLQSRDEPGGIVARMAVQNALHGDVRVNGLWAVIGGAFFGFFVSDTIDPLKYLVFFIGLFIILVFLGVIWANRIEGNLRLKDEINGLNDIESEIKGNVLRYLWVYIITGMILGYAFAWLLHVVGF